MWAWTTESLASLTSFRATIRIEASSPVDRRCGENRPFRAQTHIVQVSTNQADGIETFQLRNMLGESYTFGLHPFGRTDARRRTVVPRAWRNWQAATRIVEGLVAGAIPWSFKSAARSSTKAFRPTPGEQRPGRFFNLRDPMIPLCLAASSDWEPADLRPESYSDV